MLRTYPHNDLYLVSKQGKIWSTKRNKFLSPFENTSGHLFVDLWRDRKRMRKSVHSIVLETYKSDCPLGMECCHFDDNPKNNRLENLRWGNRKGNIADKIRNRADKKWIAGRSKLCASDVLKIRKQSKEGVSNTKISKIFGVTQSAISKVVARRAWGWVC